MNKTSPIKILVAIVALSAAACGTTRGSAAMAESTTASAASEPSTGSSIEAPLMQRLQQARAFDRSQSTAFTRSAPSLDHYYSRKADEVTDVMRRLRAGQDVAQDDINHALDNSLAATFGVPVQ